MDLSGNTENRLNWAPRLGATYQIDEKTVIRGGYGRTYDIGVFGSLFGHSVTQNLPVLAFQELRGAENFDAAFTLAQGPTAPVFPTVPASGQFALQNGIFTRALPRKQRPPTVDAFNVTVQRQLSDSMSVEVGYVGNRGRDVFAGDGPDVDVERAHARGFPERVPQPAAAVFCGPVDDVSGPGRHITDGRRASTISATARTTGTTRCRRSSTSGSPTATPCR